MNNLSETFGAIVAAVTNRPDDVHIDSKGDASQRVYIKHAVGSVGPHEESGDFWVVEDVNSGGEVTLTSVFLDLSFGMDVRDIYDLAYVEDGRAASIAGGIGDNDWTVKEKEQALQNALQCLNPKAVA